MERIIVFSDSHLEIHNMENVLMTMPGITKVIHLGDMLKDIKTVMKNFSSLDYCFVPGNNDFSNDANELVITISNKRFFITHGHRYGVKINFDRIVYRALSLGCDVCLFGHTHMPYMKKEDDILILNPGSIGDPYKPSYGIIEVEDSKISADILQV